MFKWFKSFFAKPEPKPDPESSIVIFFEDGSVEVPDRLSIQELRRQQFFPVEVIDALEAARDKRVVH